MHVDNWYGLFEQQITSISPDHQHVNPNAPPPLKKSLGLKWKYWDFGRKSKRIIMVNGGWGGAPLFCSILRPFRLEDRHLSAIVEIFKFYLFNTERFLCPLWIWLHC